MVADTKIEWADHTFNPWVGCTKVGPGCDNCYAEAQNKRFKGGNWGVNADRRLTSDANWKQPVRWNNKAEEPGIRPRVFVASMADVFDKEVPPSWRQRLWQLIVDTPNLDWLIVTKRIGNAPKMLPSDWLDSMPENIWIGATVTNQEEADRDIPKLVRLPAKVRFLSMEPLLGSVNLGGLSANAGILGTLQYNCLTPPKNEPPYFIHRHINWVIVGGESGPNARPMHPDWAMAIKRQCKIAEIPFFFKQWGEWLPTKFVDTEEQMNKCRVTAYLNNYGQIHDGSQGVDFFGTDEEVNLVGKAIAGRLLDGTEYSEVPQ
ncbi:MAG: phage Gp37/Gp68 family protein [Oceanobacter sp.]